MSTLVLLPRPAAAQAGSYSGPAYSGGTYTDPNNSANNPLPPVNDGYVGNNNSQWGGGTGAAYGVYPGTTQPFSGSSACTGDIMATFTWTPADNSSAPPPPVIVTETTNSGWYANDASATGDYSNPYKFPEIISSSGFGKSETGTWYSTKPGAASIPLTVSLTASSGGTGSGSGVHNASDWVAYSASVTPITISLGGTTPDSSGNPNILVGQRCTATVNGIPTGNGWSATYSWSVSGTTFESWSATTPQIGTTPANSQASYYNPGPIPATNSTSWYWNDPSSTSETVSCTVMVTPPAGEGSPFTLTATAPMLVKVVVPPFSCNQHQGYITTNTNPQSGVTILVAASPTLVYTHGETWIGKVQTPALFGSGGYWYYCQLITPQRSHTYDSGTVACTQNGIQGLDTETPYMADPEDPFSSNISGWLADNTQHEDGDSPDTLVADPNLGTADSISIDELFFTSLMYVPPGSNTQPVPLYLLGWLWNASPSEPAGGWSSAKGTNLGTVAATPVSSTNTFPNWTLIEGTSVGSGW